MLRSRTEAVAEIAKVNIPVAILIWLTIIPMLMKTDFRSLSEVGRRWRGISVTVGVMIGSAAGGTFWGSVTLMVVVERKAGGH